MEPESDHAQPSETRIREAETAYQKLRLLLVYATLAPSVHNTQPWRFRITEDAVELHADRSRQLPVADPQGRELVISCGSALFHLRTAIRYFGHTCEVDLFPHGQAADLLARLQLLDGPPPTSSERALFQAITRRRHTDRGRFQDRQVAHSMLAAARQAAAKEGTVLVVVDSDEKREQVLDLIMDADHIQMANSRFRRELAEHIVPDASDAREGVPASALGQGQLLAHLAPWMIRHLKLGDARASWDHQLLQGAPVLGTLFAHGDTPRAWLCAGQALARVALGLCRHGVSASYFNQPIEVAELRVKLRKTLVRRDLPQMLMRMRYGRAATPAPRRPVPEVLIR
jgi:nitroreductase